MFKLFCFQLIVINAFPTLVWKPKPIETFFKSTLRVQGTHVGLWFMDDSNKKMNKINRLVPSLIQSLRIYKRIENAHLSHLSCFTGNSCWL